MTKHIIAAAKEVAIAAAYEAGKMLKERFGHLPSFEEKDSSGDIITAADYAAEDIILRKITGIFPDHYIRSEEFGENGLQSDWMWLIDPLDGTNNFAVGLPVFAVSITLLYQRQAVMSVIYEPITDRMYSAVKNEGAYCGGAKLICHPTGPLKKARIGWIQGHIVQNDTRAAKLRHHLELQAKRVMRLWAPTLQWSMLARGDLDGIVLYNSEGEDLYSGILMVQEAGGTVIGYDGTPVAGMIEQPYLIACRPDLTDYFKALVEKGLQH